MKPIYCSYCDRQIKQDSYYWKVGSWFFHDFTCCSRFVKKLERNNSIKRSPK